MTNVPIPLWDKMTVGLQFWRIAVFLCPHHGILCIDTAVTLEFLHCSTTVCFVLVTVWMKTGLTVHLSSYTSLLCPFILFYFILTTSLFLWKLRAIYCRCYCSMTISVLCISPRCKLGFIKLAHYLALNLSPGMQLLILPYKGKMLSLRETLQLRQMTVTLCLGRSLFAQIMLSKELSCR